jgi:hypothetical protein
MVNEFFQGTLDRVEGTNSFGPLADQGPAKLNILNGGERKLWTHLEMKNQTQKGRSIILP